MKATTLLPLLSILGSAIASADLLGVDPSHESRYVPSANNTFTCLDGNSFIPFDAVNDDYCDCADGSDEPGTAACEGRSEAWFYCKNKGHVPARVRSSRVNDGICDPECCDGSDEWKTGACPDRCEEVGRSHREKTEAENRIRRTGAKIRSTYVKFALAEKKRLQDELVKKRGEVAEKEKQVDEARIALESAESKSKEDLERKKASPLFVALTAHRHALTRLRSRADRLQNELDTVLGILEELSVGYNPNYQDMAVKAAVLGYQEVVGKLPVNGDATDGEGQTEHVTKGIQDIEEEITNKELHDVISTDLESVLLSVDDEVEEGESLLYRLEEYIPDSLYDYYDTARDVLVDWLLRFGVVKLGTPKSRVDGPHISAARERHSSSEKELNKLLSEIRSTENTLERIISSTGYGPQGEWKKLDGTCIDTIYGDYTYELCFFGKATQKSNKDSSSNKLGTFMEWNTNAEPGTFEYYTKQQYKNGAKCWNGPMRSVTVDLACGTTNAILAVSEPEKCEYHFKATTPALCWPIEAGAAVVSPPPEVKDEL